MRTARCGAGLGDSLYLQGVLRVMSKDEHMVAMTDYPDVFSQLENVTTKPFIREGIEVVAHYNKRKHVVGTSQWQDCCIAAGLPPDTPFILDWKLQNKRLVKQLRSLGKPILVVETLRTPMGRSDNFGRELLPDGRLFQRILDRARDKYAIVQIGSGKDLYPFKNVDLNLTNCTSVADLIDVAMLSDRMLGYCSFFVPLAESLSRSALFVWTSAGLNSGQQFIRAIRPEKVLHSPDSKYIVDDWKPEAITEAIDAFLG